MHVVYLVCCDSRTAISPKQIHIPVHTRSTGYLWVLLALLVALLQASGWDIFAQPSSTHQTSTRQLFVEGVLLDSASSEPITGAAIRVIQSNTGTYSTAKGWFRLPLAALPATIRITTLGYKPLEYTIDSSTVRLSSFQQFTLRLVPAPVQLGSVEVRALTADEIVRRASAARPAHAGNLISVTTKLYTKISGSGRLKIPFRADQTQSFILETIARIEDLYKPKREQRTTILHRRQTANIPAQNNILAFNEFFNVLDDDVKIANARLATPLSRHALNVYQYDILGQRSFGNGKTAFVLSFHPKSSAFPGFEGQLVIANESFALIEATFRPVRTNMTFVDNLHYTQKFTEYETNGQSVWIPTFLQVKLSVSAQALMGAAQASGEFIAQSIAQEVSVRADPVPLASGVQSQSAPRTTGTPQPLALQSPKLSRKARTTVVEPNADSTTTQFWQQNSLYALSQDEIETYRRIDSIQQVKLLEPEQAPPRPVQPQPSTPRRSVSLSLRLSFDDDNETETSEVMSVSASAGQSSSEAVQQSSISAFHTNALLPFSLSSTATLGINPIVNRTRVTSWIVGAELLAEFFDINGNSFVAASMRGSTDLNSPEQRRLWGEAAVRATLLRWNDQAPDGRKTNESSLTLLGSVFSRLSTLQERRFTTSMLNPFNLNAEYLFFGDRFDFYREDGWSAGIALNTGLFYASLAHTRANNLALRTSTENERMNLPMHDGRMNVWRIDAGWNYVSPLLPATPLASERPQIGVKISGELGEFLHNRQPTPLTSPSFLRAEGQAFALLPTFQTGYNPMSALLTVSAGVASSSTPVQRQFVAMRRYPVIGAIHDLLSAHINALGGTQYAHARLEHSFSDVPWRVLGLPTWRERGVEVSIFGAAAWYGNPPGTTSLFLPTPEGTAYTELGFSVSRIPLFLIDFLYLRFDAGWRVGAPPASGMGNFGFSFSAYFSL